MTDTINKQHVDLDQYIRTQFAASEVRFYHAENLSNFRTYCASRAVLCREELMLQEPDNYTRFRSDHDDKKLNVLGRVFGNVTDFGAIFSRAHSGQPIPNIYGPILLIFSPTSFSVMNDIRITPKSIATHLQGWLQASIKKTEEIDTLLEGDNFGSPINPDWYSCELSCANRSLSFDHLELILVEPISIGMTRLVDVVQSHVNSYGIGVPVRERRFKNNENVGLLSELVSACEMVPTGLTDAQWQFDTANLPARIKIYSSASQGRVVGWCRYFYFGTLEELRKREDQASQNEYKPPSYECICGALKDTVDYECEDCGHCGSNTDPPDHMEDGIPFYSDMRDDSEQLKCENCSGINLELSYPEEYCSRCTYRFSRDDK